MINSLTRSGFMIAILTLVCGLAQSQQLKSQSLSAVEDYVVSLDAPGTKQLEYYDTSRGNSFIDGDFVPTMSARAQMFFDDLSPILLELEIFEDEISLEQWVESREEYDDLQYQIAPDDVLREKIFDDGYDQTMGQTTYFRYVSPTSVFEDGEFVKRNFRKPVGKQFRAVFDGRALIALSFMDDQAREIDPAQEATLNRIAASLGVRYEELFESFRETEFFSSKSGNYLSIEKVMSGNVDMQVPVDWIANESGSVSARRDGAMLGKIVVEVAPFDAGSAGGVSPKLTILVEGLPDGRLSPRTYKRKGDEVLGRYVQNPKRLDRNDVSAMFMEAAGYPHCVAEPYRNVKTTSDGISATTYTGKDTAGRDIKVRHYSGGGSFLACNYIFIASPQEFDQVIETVETMLGTLEVEVLGPWHSSN